MPQATQEGRFTLPIASLQLARSACNYATSAYKLATTCAMSIGCYYYAMAVYSRRRELGVPKHTHTHTQRNQRNSRLKLTPETTCEVSVSLYPDIQPR